MDILTSAGGHTRFSNIFSGMKRYAVNEQVRPDAGKSTAKWDPDIPPDWVQGGGDVCSGTSDGGIVASGTNGKAHWAVIAIGTTHGLYPQKQITGYRFKASQDSGAGHGMYIMRHGMHLRSINSSSKWLYDAGGVLSRGSHGTKTYDITFDNTVINKLNSGYVFDELMIQFSTDGGSTTRTSSVKVYDFGFKYKNEVSGSRIIIPAKRPYANRGEQNRIA